jgi:hypothetical protein
MLSCSAKVCPSSPLPRGEPRTLDIVTGVTEPGSRSRPGTELVEDVARLQQNFPLLARQRRLGAEAKRTHRRLLAALIREGRPPTDLDPAIVKRLAAEDVIVTEAGRITGAYPFSLVATPHRIRIGDTSIYAMCAIDALAISAVWKVSTRTESECAVTGGPIHVEQQPPSVVAEPSDLRLGVRWQAPRGSASTSMCREMVFLADPSVALRWQRDGAEASIYTLEEGVEFGRRFFDPLLVD